MHGWTGRILLIDLSKQSTRVLKPSRELYERYIGGRGLAGHFLRESITESWSSPHMPLLLFTGPLVDTPSPTSGRMTIMSRSPLTGTIGDASVGGRLATQIKKAGWDGIVIDGQSRVPCGVKIRNDDVEFEQAAEMTGLDTSRIFDALKSEGSVMTIGPAAERGVRFSNIVIDRRFFAGRNGLGLVMGAKNLKFLSVRGSGQTAVHDLDALNGAREEILRLAAASPILKGPLGISHFGTGAIYDLIDSRRMMPTRNFRATVFESAKQMNAWSYTQRYGSRKTGCVGCSILCKRVGRDRGELPEFETMSHFSALIGNNDLDAVVRANRVCSETGMDTISAAVTLACYLEIEERRLDSDSLPTLLLDIAHSRGVGNRLKEGSYHYAQTEGRPECAMTVKKQELPAYDPRGAYGMALSYALSTRGACHLRAYPISHEILRKPVVTDRFTFSGKARIIKISEDTNAVIDSLTACKFLFFASSLEEYARALYGATGMKTSAQELLKLGERIYFSERMMNARNGFKAKDDDLPMRFFSEPGDSGEGISIDAIDREAFLDARSNYYKIRGCSQDGVPEREKADELGIDWGGSDRQ